MLRKLGLRTLWGAAACIGCALSEPVMAYAFTVAPIRLDFNETSRNGVITVANDDQLPLSFQIRLMRWTQNDQGQDHYEPSSELVYFPRLMVVDPQDKRVIRIGATSPASDVEVTYRLYIEETAPPGMAPGTAVAVRMRFAIPVFVAPKVPRIEGSVDQVQVNGKQLNFEINNSGNRHFRIDAMRLQRGESVLQEAVGGYVLAGAKRRFHLDLPSKLCEGGTTLQLRLEGEGIALQQPLTLSAANCRF